MNDSGTAGAARWTGVHKVLHWLIAAAVLYQLSLGFDLGDLADDDPRRLEVLRLHAATGLTILVAMLVRLCWRLTHAVPPPPVTLGPTAARLSLGVHRAFYVVLLALPVSGFLLLAASAERVPLPGFDLPGFGPADRALRATLWWTHAVLAITASLMVLGHIGAAVRHAVLRDGTFSAMLPGR